MKTVTKTFEIEATPSVMKKFENFLGFLHFNGGHSGLFAMSFDGDGADTLKCKPEPVITVGANQKEMNDIAGASVEIASEDGYKGIYDALDDDDPDNSNESRKIKAISFNTRSKIHEVVDNIYSLPRMCYELEMFERSDNTGMVVMFGDDLAITVMNECKEDFNKLMMRDKYDHTTVIVEDIQKNWDKLRESYLKINEHQTKTLTSIELITDDDTGMYSGDDFDFGETGLDDWIMKDPDNGKRLAQFMREYADGIEKRYDNFKKDDLVDEFLAKQDKQMEENAEAASEFAQEVIASLKESKLDEGANMFTVIYWMAGSVHIVKAEGATSEEAVSAAEQQLENDLGTSPPEFEVLGVVEGDRVAEFDKKVPVSGSIGIEKAYQIRDALLQESSDDDLLGASAQSAENILKGLI